MDNIEKALQDLAKALEGNDLLTKVTVTFTMTKPKSSKANPSK